MDDLLELLNRPFFYGFASALLLCLGGWILSGGPRRMMRIEMRKLKETIAERDSQLGKLRDQLHTQMEISNKGNEVLKRERNELAERVKNLEINIATLQQKPGRAERRELEMYQIAVRRMNSEAPGFAPAWESALGKAESDLGQREKGVGGYLRNLVTKALPSHAQEAEDNGSDEGQLISTSTTTKGEDERGARSTRTEDKKTSIENES